MVKRALVQFKQVANGDTCGFFGVFDGHGGPSAAEFVKHNLFAVLQRNAHFPGDMPTALSAVLLSRWLPVHACFPRVAACRDEA